MKVAEYLLIYEDLRDTNRELRSTMDNLNCGEIVDIKVHNKIEGLKNNKEVLENCFKELPTVKIQYSIGSRRYYQEVIKLGKTYLKNGRKLNKTTGCMDIKEIPEITEEMKKEMISDSYYY